MANAPTEPPSRHRRHSHRRKDQRGDSSKSAGNSQVDALDVDELRRKRADYYSKRPEERPRHPPAMYEQGPLRHSTRPTKQKEYLEGDSVVTVRKVRKKSHSEHRHRHPKHRESGGGSSVYVYDQGEDEKHKPKIARRHTTESSLEGKRPHRSDAVYTRTRHVKPSNEGHPKTERKEISPEEFVKRRRSYHDKADSVVERKENRADSTTAAGSSKISIARSTSMRENSTVSTSRPSLQRSQTSIRKVRPVSYSVPATPSIAEKPETVISSSAKRKADSSSGFFGSLFPATKPSKPEPLVECLTCLSDDIPASKAVKLACSHRMCHDCLKRLFNLSLTDPTHMPPKCCTSEPIPPKHVEKLFDNKFKKKWNYKYQEFMTKNRIYCPSKGCGEWIKPANIYIDTSGGANGGRKFGKCSRCRMKVCVTCNGKWHTSRECPKDEATSRFAEIAKKEGWQRCFNCSAMVELREGCNHMTCRCRAEFCMICGAKWKSCDCPWFNYETVEADRLHHINIPPPPLLRPGRVRVGGFAAGIAGAAVAAGVAVAAAHNAQRGYRDELRQRDEQVRRDEAIARRMQALGLADGDGNDDDDDGSFVDLDGGRAAFGNGARHFANHDFVRRAADLLTGPAGPRQARAADRLVAEARAVRGDDRQQMDGGIGAAIAAAAAVDAMQQQPLRQHTAASRRYNQLPQVRASERVVPRRNVMDYMVEAGTHRPDGGGGNNGFGEAARWDPPMAEPPRPVRRHSAMAGLTRSTTEGRVEEWRRHVSGEPGVPGSE